MVVYSRSWIAIEWSEYSGAKHIISAFDVAVIVGGICRTVIVVIVECVMSRCCESCDECG